MAELSSVAGELVKFASDGMVTESEALAKLEGFAKLQDGWHYGSGRGPSRYVRSVAKVLISFALSRGLRTIDVFPGKNGEVTVAIYCGEDDHSFQVRSNLTFRYWNESDADSDVIDGLSMTEVLESIKDLINIPWNSFTTSTFGIGTRPKATSGAKRSKTLVTAVAYLPYKMTVLSIGLGAYVLMHADFISRESLRSHQYFGVSMSTPSPQDTL